MDVFFADADRQVYLGQLGQYAARHGLAIKAYCLMSNHTHLVAVPAAAESLRPRKVWASRQEQGLKALQVEK